MIELVIAACLSSGECRENRLTYDAHDVSLMTCMVAGQAEDSKMAGTAPGLAREALALRPRPGIRASAVNLDIVFVASEDAAGVCSE